MDEDLSKLKWERRKKAGYAPTLRSGSTMAHWASKGMGVLFGGVLDEEKDEESMESVFYNDLWVLIPPDGAYPHSFAYNPAGNGRWTSLNLKRRKKMGGKRRAKKVEVEVRDEEEGDMDVDGEEGDDDEVGADRK